MAFNSTTHHFSYGFNRIDFIRCEHTSLRILFFENYTTWIFRRLCSSIDRFELIRHLICHSRIIPCESTPESTAVHGESNFYTAKRVKINSVRRIEMSSQRISLFLEQKHLHNGLVCVFTDREREEESARGRTECGRTSNVDAFVHTWKSILVPHGWQLNIHNGKCRNLEMNVCKQFDESQGKLRQPYTNTLAQERCYRLGKISLDHKQIVNE